MRPKFEVFRSKKDKQWYWRLKAVNGRIICQSEGYKRRENAYIGVKSVVNNAEIADILYPDD